MKADSAGRVCLSGPLTSAEVPELYRRSLDWGLAGLPEVIDLDAVERADSSALSLLLEWRAWAEHAGRSMRFINVPRSLCVMASLSQIEGLLGWRTLDFDAEGESPQCCS